MNAVIQSSNTERYAHTIKASRTGQWNIETDVIKGRRFDLDTKYLPDGLSLVHQFPGLTERERRFASQIQVRTYANVFGLVERFITAKLLEIGRDHWLGDQNALAALVRFSDEELKHQALFRRIHDMMEATMPAGYRFDVNPDEVARAVLGKTTWAVLVLTLHIELFVQMHYRQSIAPDGALSPLFKDVFLFHWKDEARHVVLDELELHRHDATLTAAERDQGVDDFIALVGAVDGILQLQARADTDYFAANCGRLLSTAEMSVLAKHFLRAYRWQYILSGAAHPRFQAIVGGLVSPAQMQRIGAAVAPLQAGE